MKPLDGRVWIGDLGMPIIAFNDAGDPVQADETGVRPMDPIRCTVGDITLSDDQEDA